MVNKIICLAGVKRHKGSLLGISVLLFLAARSLASVLTIYLGGGNDIRQELYNYLYPLIQGEVALTYQNGVPVYMPVPHLKPDHIS